MKRSLKLRKGKEKPKGRVVDIVEIDNRQFVHLYFSRPKRREKK